MKIFWSTVEEFSKIKPRIFEHNLKADGMFITAPGTLIFRTRNDALRAVEEFKKASKGVLND